MSEYGVKLKGCDDQTCFNIELTDEEHKLLQKISEISKSTSRYNCMPVLEIGEPHELDEDELNDEDGEWL